VEGNLPTRIQGILAKMNSPSVRSSLEENRIQEYRISSPYKNMVFRKFPPHKNTGNSLHNEFSPGKILSRGK